MVVIRDAVEADLPRLANPAALASPDAPVRTAWARACSGAGAILVAEAGGRFAGRLYVDLARVRPYLWSLAVDEALRGGGIGTALIAEAERRAGARGAKEVEIAVSLTNPRAEALYRRLGYEDAGCVTDRWVDVRVDGSRHEIEEECRLLRKRL